MRSIPNRNSGKELQTSRLKAPIKTAGLPKFDPVSLDPVLKTGPVLWRSRRQDKSIFEQMNFNLLVSSLMILSSAFCSNQDSLEKLLVNLRMKIPLIG